MVDVEEGRNKKSEATKAAAFVEPVERLVVRQVRRTALVEHFSDASEKSLAPTSAPLVLRHKSELRSTIQHFFCPIRLRRMGVSFAKQNFRRKNIDADEESNSASCCDFAPQRKTSSGVRTK